MGNAGGRDGDSVNGLPKIIWRRHAKVFEITHFINGSILSSMSTIKPVFSVVNVSRKAL